MMPTLADCSDLTIVVPAFNEERGIVATLRSLTSEVGAAEIIVVDDCSSDGTSETVRSFTDVKLLRHSFNCGQGAALKTGMRAATREYVAWFDADNEHRVVDLAKLYDRMKSDGLVACIGQRTTNSASLTRATGKALIRLIGWGLKIRSGSDLNCGLRIFQRKIVLRYLSLIPDQFSASLVSTLIMLERRYPIAFEEVKTNERMGTSTVRLRDGFEAILQLIRSVLLFAPMRFFVPIGTVCFLVGITYSLVIDAIVGQGIPVGGVFLMVTGVQILILGLLGDQLSQLRLSQMGDVFRRRNPMIDMTSETKKAMFVGAPPPWTLRRPKSFLQATYDFLGAPLRMIVLPDHLCERLHLTSLRGERLARVLPVLSGRVLDIGAGDNMLVNIYRKIGSDDLRDQSVGVDIVDWASDCVIVPDCSRLPFPDAFFDTVCFIACINHIPERSEALKEAHRVLRPGGRIVLTMIERLIGNVGHALWWYSEDKHRDVADGEVMGMDKAEVRRLLSDAGFALPIEQTFLYGLNTLYVAGR